MSGIAVEAPCPKCGEETVFDQEDVAEDGRTVTCGHCGTAYELPDRALAMFEIFADLPSLEGMYRPLEPGEKEQTEEELLAAIEKATMEAAEEAGLKIEKVERVDRRDDGSEQS